MFIEKIRSRILKARFEKKCSDKLKIIYNDLTVKRGPFKNMQYPDFVSTGSTLFPKLIGIYEKEIGDIIENCKKQSYEIFIDVGCAEGYYAIGMAKYGCVEQVIAYDIDDRAKKLCQKMAERNQVHVNIRNELTAQELQRFPFDKSKRSFIMADCEGYERELFTRDNVENLKNVECLIEIHDWCKYEDRTKEVLLKLFENTHQCKVIEGIDDYDKAYDYKIEELEDFTIQERLFIFAEGRRRLGRWLWCIPRLGNE